MSRLFTLVALVCLALPAAAQDCTIAAYADPHGTVSEISPPGDGGRFSVYVVIFAEDTVAAAAYSLTVPSDMYLQARFSGPSGDGLVIDEPTGTSVALAECVIGFGDNPVLVDEYVYIALPTYLCGTATVSANLSQDPELPQYVTCNDIIRDCTPGVELWICEPCADEACSFGRIKSLYQ